MQLPSGLTFVFAVIGSECFLEVLLQLLHVKVVHLRWSLLLSLELYLLLFAAFSFSPLRFLKQLRIGIEQTLKAVGCLLLSSVLLHTLMLPLCSELHLHLKTAIVDSLQVCEQFLWIDLDIELQLVLIVFLVDFDKPSQL